IKPEEIKIEFFRSSGPGGQNVNKRETAVRIIHLPTNISAACQSERSQQGNRERAMRLLYSKIHQYRAKMKEEEKASLRGEKISIEWGRQIRSYVLHPYKMVKDHRTDYETSQVDKVLEGELDEIIEAELKLKT
ncbi:MAG: peptide chain release factor-like protein, partial [Patescibacteria group bacterium]